MLLLPKVYEEMRLQENALMTFDLGSMSKVKVTQNVIQYPQNHVTYTQHKFEVATSKSLRGDVFTKKIQ